MIEYSKRELQIQCMNCKKWTILKLELGEIAYFNTKECPTCGSRNRYDSKSTRTYNNDKD